MTKRRKINRREFLTTSGTVAGAAALTGSNSTAGAAPATTEAVTFRSPAGSLIPFRRSDLLSQGRIRSFSGPALSEIAFPLGGIGTGTVSLGGRGDLRDWEMFNRPNKGKSLPFTFVALRTQSANRPAAVRVVEAPLQPPFRGAQGYPRERAQGLPHLKSARFTGAYPLAEIAFEDDTLPVEIALEAFNPFIPLESDDSSLPVAILRYRLTNRTRDAVSAALAFSILNPIGYDGRSALGGDRFAGFGKNVTRVRREPALAGLDMTSEKYARDDIHAGSMALVTTHPQWSARTAWQAGAWWDSFQKWFDEYAADGTFDDPGTMAPTADGVSNYATLAPGLTLQPGETQRIEFILAWHFPVRENYWNHQPEVRGQKLRNHYGTLFQSAWDVAVYTATNLRRLEEGTRAFQKALFSTTLPSAVLDAVSSQVSILRTNTCLLLEGKQFFAFEGTNDDSGCCWMNCTHVWNYEQALAHLFPDLERSMRRTDFQSNLRADGSMAFRTLLPLGKAQWTFKPAADGQMGCIMKLYREWKLSGDDAFLRELWPEARRALEYAWKDWDADGDGVMEGEQHNTYDIEFYGPNTMMGTLYLGALLAAEQMARAVGDEQSAARYRQVFESGRVKLDAELWRDGYYVQRVPDAAAVRVPSTEHREGWHASAIDQGQIKYQYGDGCLSDQLLGQWFAEVVGLGHLLPGAHVRETLLSIYRHNFKHNFFDHPNTQRLYALNDDKGLLLCSWPQGRRPALPFVYSDEVWTGIEYQVASHLIYEGLVAEGLAITRAVRDRYDGQKRNPWNEVECGSHYARALSSWALLTALSGYRYSAPERRLAFGPRLNAENFRSLFTTGTAWGTFEQRLGRRQTRASVEIVGGGLTLSHLGFSTAGEGRATATRNGADLTGVKLSAGGVDFSDPVTLKTGDRLVVTVRG
ncbi:MAG: GH116 family glycosyl-hydrolase [Acidobacteriota bacterium]